MYFFTIKEKELDYFYWYCEIFTNVLYIWKKMFETEVFLKRWSNWNLLFEWSLYALLSSCYITTSSLYYQFIFLLQLVWMYVWKLYLLSPCLLQKQIKKCLGNWQFFRPGHNVFKLLLPNTCRRRWIANFMTLGQGLLCLGVANKSCIVKKHHFFYNSFSLLLGIDQTDRVYSKDDQGSVYQNCKFHDPYLLVL